MRALAQRLRLVRRQDGAVLPMVALLLIVILGMTAFAIDLSGWYFDQRHLQTQADSGVLAAANQFVSGLSNCSSTTFQQQVKQTVYNYADSAEAGSSGIASNGEKGTVSANVNVNCSPSYIDATLTNTSPPTFFAGALGIHAPAISAHARVSLEQVTEEGGSGIFLAAIEKSQTVYNNQLIQIHVNDNSSSALHSLICDGSTTSTDTEMINLEENGCPLTQVNQGGDTCPAIQLNPPSCLWEFTHVDEGSGYDTGEVPRFENGAAKGTTLAKTCSSPNPIPTNNYAQYLSTGTVPAKDPRLITIYVVPDNSFTTTAHLIPILGYAAFYVEGWDHDPCIGTSDPASPETKHTGSIWGYFITDVTPSGTNVVGSGPCNPDPNYAYTYNCTYGLTQ